MAETLVWTSDDVVLIKEEDEAGLVSWGDVKTLTITKGFWFLIKERPLRLALRLFSNWVWSTTRARRVRPSKDGIKSRKQVLDTVIGIEKKDR
jgi:hypothetical protein